jgi:transcription antitermination protein NusB
MKTASDPRHRHRAQIIQHLFAASFQPVSDPMISQIWASREQIDPYIAKAAPEWPLEKLNPIDLAILRLATYELLIDKKAPLKVIIDEAIELAKEFGSSGSPAFINGALGKLVQNNES